MPFAKKRSYGARSISANRSAKKPTYKQPVVSRFNQISNRPALGTNITADFIYFDKGFTLTSNLGITGRHVFNLSNLFDPDRTGIGHQPVNFDQLMAIYEQYVVTEVDYKVIFRNAADASSAQLCGITISDVVGGGLDARVLIENGQTQWGLMRPVVGDSEVREMKGHVDIAKIHGITRQALLSDNRYRGSGSSGPTEDVSLQVWNEDETSATNTLVAAVELRFKAVLMGSTLNALS